MSSGAAVLKEAVAPRLAGHVLHVGCGTMRLPDWLHGEPETRLDVDVTCKPDIVANMLDMGNIGGFDILYCSHALEHLYPHQVPVALAEFRRVLKPGGLCMVIVPDLEYVRPTEEVLYESMAGPITGLDMIYGFRKELETKPYMAHHTGFVPETLNRVLMQAGFRDVRVQNSGSFNLYGIGTA